MQILMIRHGQTAGNAQRRYIGKTDEPLCPEGILEAAEAGKAAAEMAGEWQDVNTIYVTPLLRTRQTAEILFPDKEQQAIDGLREMSFGEFENRTAREMEKNKAYRAWVDSGCTAPCPGGESKALFSERVCEGFAKVLRELCERGTKTAVFVVHGGTIMAALERFGRPEKDFYEYHTENCDGFRCIASPVEDGVHFALSEITRISFLKRRTGK